MSKFITAKELYETGYEFMDTVSDVLIALEPKQVAFIEPKTGLIVALFDGDNIDEELDDVPVDVVGFTGSTQMCNMVLLLTLDTSQNLDGCPNGKVGESYRGFELRRTTPKNFKKRRQ